MRRVRVFKYEKLERVKDGHAWFHRWGCAFEEFETGPGNFTTAVIERDTGVVETPEAALIEFVDTLMAGRDKG